MTTETMVMTICLLIALFALMYMTKKCFHLQKKITMVKEMYEEALEILEKRYKELPKSKDHTTYEQFETFVDKESSKQVLYAINLIEGTCREDNG